MSLHPVLPQALIPGDDLIHLLSLPGSHRPSIHPSIYLPPSLPLRASSTPGSLGNQKQASSLASSSNPAHSTCPGASSLAPTRGLPEAHCHRTYQRRLKASAPADGQAARGSGVGVAAPPRPLPPGTHLALRVPTRAPAGAAAAAPVASVRSSGLRWATAQSPGVVQGPAGSGLSSPARRALGARR